MSSFVSTALRPPRPRPPFVGTTTAFLGSVMTFASSSCAAWTALSRRRSPGRLVPTIRARSRHKNLDVWVRPDPVNAQRVLVALSDFGAPLHVIGGAGDLLRTSRHEPGC